MSRELEELWRRFSLTTDEGEGVDVGRADLVGAKWCLVGRVLSVRPFALQALKSAMLGAWRPKAELGVQEVADGIFLFGFHCKRDFEYVASGGPWHFNKHLLLLRPLEGDDSITLESLCATTFWVRLYNLPVARRTVEVVRMIGAKLG